MKNVLAFRLGTLVFGALNVAPCAVAATAPALSQTLPQSTVIPVRFEQTRAGDHHILPDSLDFLRVPERKRVVISLGDQNAVGLDRVEQVSGPVPRERVARA